MIKVNDIVTFQFNNIKFTQNDKNLYIVLRDKSSPEEEKYILRKLSTGKLFPIVLDKSLLNLYFKVDKHRNNPLFKVLHV